jgi:hypothetical protein
VTSPGVGSQTAPRAAAAAAKPEREAPAAVAQGGTQGADRPEILIGAAFAGAFLFARILRAITSDDD